jgi:hypothetical protein
MRYVTCYESVRLATRPVGLGVDVTGAGERLGSSIIRCASSKRPNAQNAPASGLATLQRYLRSPVARNT